MRNLKGLFGLALLVVIVFGGLTIFTPTAAFAGAKGPPPPPPPCPCAETIEISPGVRL